MMYHHLIIQNEKEQKKHLYHNHTTLKLENELNILCKLKMTLTTLNMGYSIKLWTKPMTI